MWQACKLTPTRTQISIQCERTSFLASFASSAGKKDIFLFMANHYKQINDVAMVTKMGPSLWAAVTAKNTNVSNNLESIETV